jgi:hypothetical protein
MYRRLPTLITLMLIASVSHAGVSNSPLPRFSDSSQSKWIYTVTGVTANRGNAGPQLETAIICTNLETSRAVHIGVEFFGRNGGNPLNNISAANGEILNVPAGATRTFGTQNSTSFQEDEVDFIGDVAINQGSARIVSTSAKLLCTAFLIDNNAAAGENNMAQLNIIKKAAQKGD